MFLPHFHKHSRYLKIVTEDTAVIMVAVRCTVFQKTISQVSILTITDTGKTKRKRERERERKSNKSEQRRKVESEKEERAHNFTMQTRAKNFL